MPNSDVSYGSGLKILKQLRATTLDQDSGKPVKPFLHHRDEDYGGNSNLGYWSMCVVN